MLDRVTSRALLMRRKRWPAYLPLAAAALLGACAANDPAPASSAAPAATVVSPEEASELAARATVVNVAPPAATADETVCRKQSVTGSHRPRVVCQTRAQRAATRNAAQDWYRSRGRNGEISQVPTVH
jgi:hypothetical protein